MRSELWALQQSPSNCTLENKKVQEALSPPPKSPTPTSSCVTGHFVARLKRVILVWCSEDSPSPQQISASLECETRFLWGRKSSFTPACSNKALPSRTERKQRVVGRHSSAPTFCSASLLLQPPSCGWRIRFKSLCMTKIFEFDLLRGAGSGEKWKRWKRSCIFDLWGRQLAPSSVFYIIY